MKKIFLAILCVMAGMSLQSCLHDDKEFFDEPAANRIESTVENTQKLLESAENGWELQYYTGEGYTGGGYTFLLNFKNGKVTVAGDPEVATSTERATSSYAVDRSMGPVITFNTYNSILHALGTPTYDNIQGQQGDWEFVVTKLTEDSIFVKGKKWGNKMVFTRLPQTVDWKEHLDSIATVLSKLNENYVAGSDDSKVIEINTSTRRIAYKNDLGSVSELPFLVTPTGVQALEQVTVGNVQSSVFELNQNGNLLVKGSEQLELAPYIPSIDEWVGNWSVQAMAGSCDINIVKSEEKADSLVGTFKVDTCEYTIGLNYDEATGKLFMGSQIIPDPSGLYYAIWFMATDLNQGTLLGEGGLYFVWHAVTKEATCTGDQLQGQDGKTYTVDSFIGAAVDASGSLMKDTENHYIFPFSWYYVSGMSRNN